MPPVLPQELLDEIISYLSHHDLPSLALVNRNIQSISYARLYRVIPPLPPRSTVLLLKVLSKRPALAAITRMCTISDLRSYSLVTWTISFFQLMSRALHNMHNLIDLRVYIIGQYASYLMGCPFRLTTLRVACDWDQQLVDWLREQNTVTNIWVFSIRHGAAEVTPDVLPSLRRALGSVVSLSALVPGRPLEAVDVSFPSPEGFTPEILALTCKVLAHSSSPIAELFVTADLTDLEVPHMLETLNVIPDELPGLQSFGLFAARGFISAAFVNAFDEVLCNFKGLKKMSIYSSQLHDALNDYLVTKDLPVHWHKACPTLESVDINGIPWLYDPSHGWMTTEAYKLTILDLLNDAKKEEESLRRRLRELT